MNIIVVEDNETMRLGLQENLISAGHEVRAFDAGAQALAALKKDPADLLITDLRMEPMDGLTVLQQARQLQPDLEVLLISAYGTVDDAVKAMKLGAADFLTKPFSREELLLRVNKIAEKLQQQKQIERLRAQNEYLSSELADSYQSMVGRSLAMQQIFSLIDAVATEDSTVLIEGESGTGKELIARAIHQKSNRRDQPFVRVNCGALNDNLLESELFGHEKGAFSGAVRQHRGRFELADGGTLFLDEIGDVSPAMQVKLLRVLQEKEFERVGGERTIRVNVRIIAATNRNLKQLIAKGEFREDLYYRLSVIPIKVPPLRQRKEDIPLLVEHFLQRLNRKRGKQKRIEPHGMELLQNYAWPGNIRELENVIERLHIIAENSVISADLIAEHLGGAGGVLNDFQGLSLDEALFQFEKRLILQALKKANGVKNRAAKILGIRTSALYYKLEKFGLME